jgi:hypothetical protein
MLDTGLAYRNMENTISIIRKAKKCKFMNSLKKSHIFSQQTENIHE